MIHFFLNLIVVFSCFHFFTKSVFAQKESSFENNHNSFNFNSLKTEHVDPFVKRAFDKPSIGLLLTGTIASLVTEPEDDHVRSQWKDHQRINKSDSHIGDILGSGAGSLAVMAGQYWHDDNSDHWKSHARGFVYGGIGIYSLKTIFGRNRPGHSHSHQSFPSGHTAISFMTATNLAYAYGWPAAAIAYPVAFYVGATRLSDDAHWFSDTVGGAFLGLWVGRAAFYSSIGEKDTSVVRYLWNEKYQIVPILANDQSGLYLSHSF